MSFDLIPISKEVEEAIKFVASATAGGVIGNRVDSWFVNLYYHEKSRIASWLKDWALTEEDKENIKQNENLKILFSQVTSNVANEIFDKKLIIWSSITESLLRNENYSFDKKQYFINLFVKAEPFTINYLAKLYFFGAIEYNVVFPDNDLHKPEINDANFGLYLGQLQSAYTGITDMYQANGTTMIKISELGKEFIDFISNSSMEKIKKMAE